jgi:hypothetical protein
VVAIDIVRSRFAESRRVAAQSSPERA